MGLHQSTSPTTMSKTHQECISGHHHTIASSFLHLLRQLCLVNFLSWSEARVCRTTRQTMSRRMDALSSLVGSRLDYANAVLVGTSSKNINRLQHIQNTLVQIVMKVPHDQTRNVSTKHLLSTLHWLPVRRRIDFKIAVLTYKLLPTGQPSCLAYKIMPYVSGRRLRSSESGTLTVLRIKSVIGSRAFRSAAPPVSNLIPVDIHTAPSLESFRVKLKTHYFQLVFC